MEFFAILVLAVVQGITEFVPISSDGHLVLVDFLFASRGLELPNPLGLTIVLHFGTFIAVLIFFRRRIWDLFTENRRTMGLIIIGSLPAIIAGPFAKNYMEEMLTSVPLGGICLIINGFILFVTRWLPGGETRYNDQTKTSALLIGMAQAVAILPGISRSGSTITTGLGMKLKREDAATFSFLLSIPAVAGACTLEAYDVYSGQPIGLPAWELALGALVSCLVGLIALRWLIIWLQKGRLHYFGFYCIAIGILMLYLNFSAPAKVVWEP